MCVLAGCRDRELGEAQAHGTCRAEGVRERAQGISEGSPSPWLNGRHYWGTRKAGRITARCCEGNSPGLTQSGNSSSNQPRAKELIKP